MTIEQRTGGKSLRHPNGVWEEISVGDVYDRTVVPLKRGEEVELFRWVGGIEIAELYKNGRRTYRASDSLINSFEAPWAGKIRWRSRFSR